MDEEIQGWALRFFFRLITLCDDLGRDIRDILSTFKIWIGCKVQKRRKMSSIKSFIASAASTIGPDARSPGLKSAEKIQVPSAKEDLVEISRLDAVLFETFGRDSPVIPVGVALTAIILTSGLFSLKSNNKAQQQAFMRMRVGAQGATVLAMMASLAVQERQKSLGVYRV